MTFSIALMLVAVGSIAGLCASLLGLGGSLIAVPALMWLLPAVGVPPAVVPAVATATSLLVTLSTSAAGARAHWLCGNLISPFGRQSLTLMLCAALGAAIGSSVLTALPSRLTFTLMAAFQAAMAMRLWCTSVRAPQGNADATTDTSVPYQQLDQVWTRIYLGGVGALASVGLAGSLIVPHLIERRLPQRMAVALASWLGMGIAAAATAGYALHGLAQPVRTANDMAGRDGLIGVVGVGGVDEIVGLVHLPAAGLLMTGSCLAALTGAALARRLDPQLLQRGIAIALFGSSLVAVTVRLA